MAEPEARGTTRMEGTAAAWTTSARLIDLPRLQLSPARSPFWRPGSG